MAKIRLTALVLPLLILILDVSLASGPSFDCHQARTWSEFQVCNDPELAALDKRMAALYLSLKHHSAERFDGHKAAQRRWLMQRANCQQANNQRTCLVNLYQQRVAELSDHGNNTATEQRKAA